MAFDKAKIFEQAKQAIIEDSLVFVEEVVYSLPLSKPTFYELFPVDSNEFNEIKELLNKNKVDQKKKLRDKWKNAEAPALQLSLYKLIASPEEIKALSMQHLDHTTQGDKINIISLGNGVKPETDK